MPLGTAIAYTVAKECRSPTSEDAAQSLGSANLAESLKIASVQLRINLATAFDQV